MTRPSTTFFANNVIKTWMPGTRPGMTRSYGLRSALRSALLQKHILRRIGRRLEAAGLVAGAVELAALGVDPLHGGDAGQDAAATRGGYLKLQPGDVVSRGARRVAGGLADHSAAVDVLPVRPGIVAADGLAVDQKGRDRFAEGPGELA